AGLGEHQTTDFIRMDGKAKGYMKGATRSGAEVQAGQRLHRRGGDLAQEPRRVQQDEPRARRLPRAAEGCNVATLVSKNEEVIILLQEHYKDVKETHTMLLAIEDKQQAARIDFSRNESPAYWCKKLQNKEALLEERKYRA
ncbi:MAG: hypothetical protein ACKPKO_65010, partial [Candidatus Fonsibacter sp.]